MSFAPRGRLSVLLALCLVLSLTVAGCGGKSDVSSSTGRGAKSPTSSTGRASSTSGTTATPPSSPSLPPKQFLARADTICRKANIQLARAKVTSKKPSALAALIRGNQAIEQRAIGELGKLKPPTELAGAWQTMLGYRRTLAQQLGVYAAAVGVGLKSFSSLGASKKKLHAELLKAGHRAGFKACGKLG